MMTANQIIKEINKETNKHLKSGHEISYSNNYVSLDLSYSEHLNKYCIMFNGKLWTYKTLTSANNKMSYFMNKYNLTT